MLPLVTASPMCWESRIGMSKSVCRAANWVNIASCQLALGTVLTSMVTLGRSLVYSALAKSSSAWAGGHSNQMKLSVSGSSVSSGIVAGALAPLGRLGTAAAVAVTAAAGREGRRHQDGRRGQACLPAGEGPASRSL